MNVEIENGLHLEHDGMQYILKKYSGKTDKEDRPMYRALGYYGKLHSAINSIITMKISESTATNLKELQEDIQQIDRYVREKLDGAEKVG